MRKQLGKLGATQITQIAVSYLFNFNQRNHFQPLKNDSDFPKYKHFWDFFFLNVSYLRGVKLITLEDFGTRLLRLSLGAISCAYCAPFNDYIFLHRRQITVYKCGKVG